jgi:hypothetical protein
MILGKGPETPPLSETAFRSNRRVQSEKRKRFAFQHISIPEVMQLGQRDIRVPQRPVLSILAEDSDGLDIEHGVWILLCVDLVAFPCLLEVVEELFGMLLGHLDTFWRYRTTPLTELEEPGLRRPKASIAPGRSAAGISTIATQ